MTIKHTITRVQPENRSTPQRRRPTRVDPKQVMLRTAAPEKTRDGLAAKRLTGMLRGSGAVFLQSLLDLYDGQPVDLQFGDKIIHFEVRDTVDEPPEEASAPPRGRT